MSGFMVPPAPAVEWRRDARGKEVVSEQGASDWYGSGRRQSTGQASGHRPPAEIS